MVVLGGWAFSYERGTPVCWQNKHSEESGKRAASEEALKNIAQRQRAYFKTVKVTYWSESTLSSR